MCMYIVVMFVLYTCINIIQQVVFKIEITILSCNCILCRDLLSKEGDYLKGDENLSILMFSDIARNC